MSSLRSDEQPWPDDGMSILLLFLLGILVFWGPPSVAFAIWLRSGESSAVALSSSRSSSPSERVEDFQWNDNWELPDPPLADPAVPSDPPSEDDRFLVGLWVRSDSTAALDSIVFRIDRTYRQRFSYGMDVPFAPKGPFVEEVSGRWLVTQEWLIWSTDPRPERDGLRFPETQQRWEWFRADSDGSILLGSPTSQRRWRRGTLHDIWTLLTERPNVWPTR